MEGIVEKRMSRKRVIKVRKLPGATISDMYHYLILLLDKKPYHALLHVGKIDVINYEEKEINYSS